ncbi:MAG: DUF1206 domain-containing protein [Gemmatimonadales bacterium]|nr:DUF1206 domain-containing protein [Gemmatimonadales bacterium]
MARAGYAAKGVLYLLIGGLAAAGAADAGGRTTDSHGAFRVVHHQPYGSAWLGVLAVGLAGYAIWRLAAAFTDAECKGSGPAGLAVRAGYAASGVVHAALTVAAVRLSLGIRESQRDAIREWTARFLDAPLGQWLVGAAGVGIIGYGGRQLYRAWSGSIDRRLDLTGVGADRQRWILGLARFGVIARGIVFAIIGTFIIRAGLAADARKAGGIDDALRSLRTEWHSRLALGVVALGLASYGGFQFVRARYRTITPC